MNVLLYSVGCFSFPSVLAAAETKSSNTEDKERGIEKTSKAKQKG